MNVGAFRAAREKLLTGQLFDNPEKYRTAIAAVEKAAAPEHVGENVGTGMSDQYKCSCGWEGVGFWDGADLAWEDWREHVADIVGLIPKECPCGKKYLPINGERACHELKSIAS